MNEFDRMASKKNEETERKKKTILMGIVVCIVLIVILGIMIMYYKNKDAHTFKLYINDVQSPVSEGFYYTNEKGETYVRAKDIAELIGWNYQNGEYGSFTEDLNSGYIESGYEIASFVSDSNVLKKYINVTAVPYTNEFGEEIQPYKANSENDTLETLTIDLPIISNDNGEIYFPLNCLGDICCCVANFENPYRMYIYNQENLIRTAQINAANFGYQSISGIYENMRLLPYGMMVVSNGSFYGVVDLYNGRNVIGLKYTDMVFAQNVKEFFVKTNSNNEESVGIINIEGKQIVPPRNYSNIQVLSDDLGLYLVEKDDEYGILNKKGEVIVHCEYDNIGLSDELIDKFEVSSSQNNKYILFDNIIVVESDEKYGLYNIDGEQLLPASFAGLGYLKSDDDDAVKNSQNVLTIEIDDLQLNNGTTRNIKAIVVQQEVDGIKKYGVYDIVSQKLILPVIFERIYGVTSKGETEYYIEFQNQTVKFTDQLSQNPEIF